jgi:hypothetical protein
MLLLLFSGAKAGVTTPPPPPPPAPKVGWFDEWDVRQRKRHDPEELERRLKEQRGFTREDFDQLTSAAPSAVPLKQITIKAPGAAVSQTLTVPADDDLDDEIITAIVMALEALDD